MAIVGQVLAAPEAGWKRIESNYANLNFSGSWIYKNDGSVYFHQTNSVSSISFKFYGTKLRVISAKNFDHSTNITMTIDGNTYTTSLYAPSVVYAVLIFENTNLSLGIHEVTITNNSTNYFDFDAIDIDDTGCLLHPQLGIPKTSLADMQIGDYIPCRYQASSGAVGTFSELGSCTMAEIPVAGSATPNGLFNFIKVDKGLLVADRVVQHSISWNTLNTGGFIEGKELYLDNIVPKLSSNSGSDGGHVVYSNNNSGYGQPYYVFDDYNNTIWTSGVADNNQWIGYVFNSSKTINAVQYTSINTSQYPTSIVLQATNDGSTWYDVVTFSNLPAGKNLLRFSDVTAKGFRIRFLTYGSSDWRGLQELKFIKKELYTSYLFRSLTGGCAYANDISKSTYALTDKGFGAFPENEWDNYIVKSSLDWKITPGDNNIWNWSKALTLCKETSVTGMTRNFDSYVSNNTMRIYRSQAPSGAYNLITPSYTETTYAGGGLGFRPVLQYIEPDGSSKQKTLWY